jgi:hypothetical protein
MYRDATLKAISAAGAKPEAERTSADKALLLLAQRGEWVPAMHLARECGPNYRAAISAIKAQGITVQRRLFCPEGAVVKHQHWRLGWS